MTIDSTSIATPVFSNAGAAVSGAGTTAASGSSFLAFVPFDGTTMTVTDTVGGVATGNVYVLIGVQFVGFAKLNVFICINGVGGVNHVFTATNSGGGSTDVEVFPLEITGGDLTAALIDAISSPQWKDDVHNDTTPYTSNSITTISANALVLLFINTFTNSGAETLSYGGSFVQVVADGDITHFSSGIAKQILAVPGTLSSSVTSSGGGTTEAATCLIAFKPAGSGPITVTPVVGAATLQGNAASLGYNLTPQTA